MAAQSAPLIKAALGSGGTLIDSEVLGKDLERMPYYDALMRPVRGRTTLIGVVAPAGRVSHKIAIGRCHGTAPFGPRHSRLLASVLPTISLAQAAFAYRRTLRADSRVQALLETLTPREREVLGYLRLGYTNEQIGAALGTRPRTVRNQLSRVYEKLGVANRSEAVGVSAELNA
jgi:DNA-binding CsgD family transcriptional regulator